MDSVSLLVPKKEGRRPVRVTPDSSGIFVFRNCCGVGKSNDHGHARTRGNFVITYDRNAALVIRWALNVVLRATSSVKHGSGTPLVHQAPSTDWREINRAPAVTGLIAASRLKLI